MLNLEDFILVGNDLLGLLEYRVKCGRAGLEGCIVDNGNRYYVNKDGSYAFNEFPAIEDTHDRLLTELLDIKQKIYMKNRKGK